MASSLPGPERLQGVDGCQAPTAARRRSGRGYHENRDSQRCPTPSRRRFPAASCRATASRWAFTRLGQLGREIALVGQPLQDVDALRGRHGVDVPQGRAQMLEPLHGAIPGERPARRPGEHAERRQRRPRRRRRAARVGGGRGCRQPSNHPSTRRCRSTRLAGGSESSMASRASSCRNATRSPGRAGPRLRRIRRARRRAARTTSRTSVDLGRRDRRRPPPPDTPRAGRDSRPARASTASRTVAGSSSAPPGQHLGDEERVAIGAAVQGRHIDLPVEGVAPARPRPQRSAEAAASGSRRTLWRGRP